MIEILGIAIGGLKAFGDNSLRGRRWHEFDLEKNNKIKSSKNKGFLQISNYVDQILPDIDHLAMY